jgi:uncharacterized protein DUF6159
MDGGRFARGMRLARESWSVVRLRPALLVIPGISALVWIAGSIVLLGPWALDVVDHHSRGRLFIDGAIGAYPAAFAATYFNVAFYTLAAATIDDRPMSVAEAFDRARARIWAIAWWALVATLVGVALRALEHLPAGGYLRDGVEWIADAAWSLATFFVVPVLALEDVGVRGALRRSAATIRGTWGESVTGAIAIGGAFVFVTLAAIGVGAAGVAIGSSGFVAGYLLTGVCAVVVAVALVVQTATGQVFRLAVYRYATGEGGTGPFAAADLGAAFKPSRARRFLRRR